MNDAWQKQLCGQLESWRAQDLERRLKVAAGTGVRFSLEGRDILSFASNDYLGLAAHPSVVAAAKSALDKSGAGASASPLIVGHKSEHLELEQALAAFKQAESALVFPSGYQAALATIGALMDASGTVILDRLAHASLLDGAKLSSARVRAFKHNDLADLTRLLSREHGRRCLVVVESLYSMDGDAAPLAELVRVTADAGALLLVDEAHATGVLGPHGRGALEALTENLRLPAHVIAMGTLSKALGSQGGFICGARTVTDTIVHAGRAYIFSTALAPAAAAAALAALRVIDDEPQRRKHVLELSQRIRTGLSGAGLEIIPGDGPIVPVLAGGEGRAKGWAERLLERGVYVPAIRYPTVKKGQARLRISVSAAHSDEDCAALLVAMRTLAAR